MISADPASFMLATTLVGPIMIVLLFASHAGAGDEARVFRWWVAGDLVLTLNRAVHLLQPQALGPQHDGVAWMSASVSSTIGTALLLLAIGLHGASLVRLSELGWSRKAVGALVFAPVAAYCMGTAVLDSHSSRVAWMFGIICMAAAHQASLLRPIVMRYRGAMTLAATLAAISLSTLVLCVVILRQPLPAPPQQGPGFPPLPALIIDFAASMLLTIGLMLTVQERLRARILQLSVTDPLTGLLNRRGAIPMLEQEFHRALRYDRPLSLALLDLDHFKRINDELGHAAGDAVLVGFARRVEALKRQTDVLARWGGEEFLIALPETTAQQACHLLDRIRARVGATPLGEGLPVVTVSCGVAAITDPSDMPRIEALIDAADRSLYDAKRTRNSVVVALHPCVAE